MYDSERNLFGQNQLYENYINILLAYHSKKKVLTCSGSGKLLY